MSEGFFLIDPWFFYLSKEDFNNEGEENPGSNPSDSFEYDYIEFFNLLVIKSIRDSAGSFNYVSLSLIGVL